MNQIPNSKSSGIYQIRNLLNCKLYIGSACNIKRRLMRHKLELNKEIHYNQHLQASWSLNGSENFEFRILEHVAKEDLLVAEQKYIDILRPEYNICQIAGSTYGKTHSEATKQKISNSHKGKIGFYKGKSLDPETKMKMSNARSQWHKNQGRLYTFLNPDQEIIETSNIRELSRIHGLDNTHMYKVHSGTENQHKGWTKFEVGDVK